MKVALIIWFVAWGQPSTQTTYYDTMEECLARGKAVTMRSSFRGMACEVQGLKKPVFNVAEMGV